MDTKESELGRIIAVSGPVVTAENMFGSFMYELVHVGTMRLIGEIIRLAGDTAIIQVYEETAGLAVSDPVERTGQLLSVELGPGIMGTIYDGIQRPLVDIAKRSKSVYIPRGVNVSPLDHQKLWHFQPGQFRASDILAEGDIYGSVPETPMIDHKIMLPPGAMGRIDWIAEDGDYCLEDPVLRLEFEGQLYEYTMSHLWPVRTPRPVASKMAGVEPLITGQRTLDGLFPVVLGGTCAVPGAFGVGKTVISQSLSKYSNSDAVVYVACGERGNECAEVLAEFPELTMQHKGQEVSIMNRTILVANTSNMPVAARSASVQTGVAFAEYLRDMGLNVSLMGDSTSRWAEAMREISGRLAEMPGESGYPAYLTARLAAFYERAGRVRCLGGPQRFGSISLVGAVSPQGGDFSDPVCVSTLSIVQVFWALSKRLARRKHFPAVDWLQSYSRYMTVLEPFYQTEHPGFLSVRTACRQLLQEDEELQETVQLVGQDSLGESEKLKLAVAKLVKEGFLQQNGFTPYDKYCPFPKTVSMLTNIMHYYQQAAAAMERSASRGDDSAPPLTWADLQAGSEKVMHRLKRMKFLDTSKRPLDEVIGELEQLHEDIDTAFQSFE
eukprot:gnl/Dysnectes_brevis/218_a248_2922.p1 GENE.gnl/Dysnectes_brevis/218_a248_2922~~gnl/Dysnectes_brevis/218_a248_2922.p1  ORF type:complete len:610 (+),score=261.70 gnl/Dysnectes_brevis/218_a248_2922:618-2447(+)